jgi:hypothetical protein
MFVQPDWIGHVLPDNCTIKVPAMSKMLPVFFALIPLAAVITACVSCP